MRTLIGVALLVLVAAYIAPSPLNAGIITSSQGTAANPNEWSVVHDSSGDHTFDNVSLYVANYTAGGYLTDGYENAWDILPGAAWISFANTVCPYCTTSDPLPPPEVQIDYVNHYPQFYNPYPGDYVSFFTTFNIDPAMYSGGVLNILADDSLKVYVNHNLIATYLQPGIPGPYNYKIGTVAISYAQIAPYLVNGNNTLQFDVTNFGCLDQGWNGDGRGFWSFGLSYIMTLDEVPEPATITLMGFGALGLLIAARRRRKA